MAEAHQELPTLSVSGEYWLDLEVPFQKYKSKWETEYGNRLRRYTHDDRISSRALDVYHQIMDETLPKSKMIALENIIDEDKEWGLNLLCQYQFAYQKSPSIVKAVANESTAYYTFDDTNLHGTYLRSIQREDKIAIIALLQLDNPDLLKNILSLQFCYGRKPRLNAANNVVDGADLVGAVDQIVNRMSQNDFREYENWHHFEHEDSLYILIKRQIMDSVERQAGQNIEEEPAEFVVLEFNDGNLKIFSSNKTIANQAKTSINSVLEVEFESIEPTVSAEEFDSTVDEIYSFDREQLDEDQKEIEGIEEFEVTGIQLSRSPFPGSPSVRMKSEKGILDTIDALQERGFDILENSRNIDTVFTEYKDRQYRLLFKDTEKENGSKVIRYDSRYPQDQERKEYENIVLQLFGIEAVFETS